MKIKKKETSFFFGEMMENKEQESINVAGVISANQLSFRLPPDLSVATSRNLQSQFFSNQTYTPGANAICAFNTGSQYVDFTRSMLVMSIRNLSTNAALAPQNAWFGPNGSACNVINRVTVSSRSGTQLELLQNANQYASYKLTMERDIGHTGVQGIIAANDAAQGAGVAMMYGSTPSALSTAAYDWANGEILRFCIPFSAFSPLLGNARSLWPSILCSGLKLELQLESAQVAMMTTSVNATDILNYSIDEIRCELECYTISDLALRSLSFQAQTGLDVLSESVHDTQASRTGSSINVDNGRSVSRALGFVYRERPVQTVADATQDKFALMPVSAAQYPTGEFSRWVFSPEPATSSPPTSPTCSTRRKTPPR